MAESHVISALVSKHSELAGLIKHHEKELERLSDELAAIHKSIKIFQPDYPIRAIKPKQHRNYNQFFKKGEGYKLVLDILREAGEPLSALAVADEAIRIKKLKVTQKERSQIKLTLYTTLNTQVKRGMIQELRGDDGAKTWCVIKLSAATI